jgi:hypothetical protein
VDGARVECGVAMGFSALMMAQVAKRRHTGFDGTGLHLVDSFEGLSAPTIGDVLDIPADKSEPGKHTVSFKQGAMAVPIQTVRRSLAEFLGIDYHKGWIPEAFGSLPETQWAFVHIDVDLYEPTKACLEYFVPRMAPGGVIVNDDYGSPLFPGGGKGWRDYCSAHELSYIVLDTGQAALIQPR